MLSNMRLCSNVLAQQVVQTSSSGRRSVDGALTSGASTSKETLFIIDSRYSWTSLLLNRKQVLPKIDRNMYHSTMMNNLS